MKRDAFTKSIINLCSWFNDHTKGTGKLTSAQCEWILGLSPRDRQVMAEFPIQSVVKAVDNDIMNPLGMGHLAIVNGYKDGFLILKLSPDGEERMTVEFNRVEKVSHWRGMTAKKVKMALEWHRTKKEKST